MPAIQRLLGVAECSLDVNPVVRSLEQWDDLTDALVTQINAAPHVVTSRYSAAGHGDQRCIDLCARQFAGGGREGATTVTATDS